MRKVVYVVITVLIATMLGWVSFYRSPGRASFSIETDKMTEDSRRALEAGKRMLQEGGESMQELATDK